MIPKNAPQWLKDAKTEYADVEVLSCEERVRAFEFAKAAALAMVAK
jgi:hypothetical protein